MAAPSPHDALQWGRGLATRIVALEVIDRSLVVGAQAFSALVPLLIVVISVGSKDTPSFADALVRRFDLKGDTAQAVHDTLGTGRPGSTITVVGVLIVIFSSLSFTRAVQRTFERTWGLAKRGVRSSGWGLAWLAVFAAYLTLFPVVRGLFGGWRYDLVSLTGTFGLWLLTPYLLLGRRVAWRRLIPQAAVTAAGMTAFGGALLIYAPRALETSSEQFGAIGVAFTLLTVLWGYGFVLVVGAATGAHIAHAPWTAAGATGGRTPRSPDGGDRAHPVG